MDSYTEKIRKGQTPSDLFVLAKKIQQTVSAVFSSVMTSSTMYKSLIRYNSECSLCRSSLVLLL